jgi:SAM-dependent methyltransferase
MNPNDLPIVGVPTNTEKNYIGRFTDISGKNVLCIGYSEIEVDELVLKYNPASISMLTNWADHGDANVKKYPLVIGDITKRTEFHDDTFDAILTLSVLEHLPDLMGAVVEMTRIVKKGGEHLHLFGPAWSSAYGHHLYANPRDKLLDFTRWEMPAHIHLLCNEEEIKRYYLDHGYDQNAVLCVMDWFYKTSLINRTFYDRYDKIFNLYFQIDKMELMYNELPIHHLNLLRAKFPGVTDFSTYGGKYKLIVMK